jgi:hypothetical protein
MKKIFTLTFLLVAVCAVQPVFSQNWLVGGGFSYYSESGTGSVSQSQFVLSPFVLYNFNDAVDFGGIVAFQWVKDNYSVFQIGPLVRYKFLRLDRITAFAQGSITYGVIMPDAPGADNQSIIVVDVGLGGDVSLTDNIGMYMLLGGVSFEHQWVSGASWDTFEFGFLPFNPTIGIFFRF